MVLGKLKIYHSNENTKNNSADHSSSHSRLLYGSYLENSNRNTNTMQQPIELAEIRRQIFLLRRNYRVNCHKTANWDITCYVLKGQNTIGSIELLYNAAKDAYEVDWAKVEGKLIGKGKLLYYIGLNEAWPCYVGPGPRSNEHSFRVWKTMENVDGLDSKTIDGTLYFRLKKQFD